MTPEQEGLVHAALGLPDAERIELIERLLDSVCSEENALTDEQLFAELERRRMEVETGAVEPIPWSQMHLDE